MIFTQKFPFLVSIENDVLKDTTWYLERKKVPKFIVIDRRKQTQRKTEVLSNLVIPLKYRKYLIHFVVNGDTLIIIQCCLSIGTKTQSAIGK